MLCTRNHARSCSIRFSELFCLLLCAGRAGRSSSQRFASSSTRITSSTWFYWLLQCGVVSFFVLIRSVDAVGEDQGLLPPDLSSLVAVVVVVVLFLLLLLLPRRSAPTSESLWSSWGFSCCLLLRRFFLLRFFLLRFFLRRVLLPAAPKVSNFAAFSSQAANSFSYSAILFKASCFSSIS